MLRYLLTLIICLLLSIGRPPMTYQIVGTVPPTSHINKMMMFGNSITIHLPAPELDWPLYWGMAATQADRDWVHQVQLHIAAQQGTLPDIAIVSADVPFWPVNPGAMITAFAPQVVIVQIGNNATTEPAQTYLDDLGEINTAADAINADVFVVGLWGIFPDDAREVKLHDAAVAYNMTWIPILDLFNSDATTGIADGVFTNEFVLWHPGNAGMRLIGQRIADAIFSKVYLPIIAGDNLTQVKIRYTGSRIMPTTYKVIIAGEMQNPAGYTFGRAAGRDEQWVSEAEGRVFTGEVISVNVDGNIITGVMPFAAPIPGGEAWVYV